MAHKSHYEELEDWFVAEILEALGDSNIKAKTELYAGDASTQDELNVLMSRSESNPIVLLGIRDRTSTSASSTNRMRENLVTIDVYVSVTNKRGKSDLQRMVYPIIRVIEKRFDGAAGPVLTDPGARCKNTIVVPQAMRSVDLPQFQMWQIPMLVTVQINLDDQ